MATPAAQSKQSGAVFGVQAQSPRPTAAGLFLAVAVIAPPALAMILLSDFLVGRAIDALFGVDVTVLGLFF